MSSCHKPVHQGGPPGTARVQVTMMSGSDHINPTPSTKPRDDSETAVELCYLSPEKLKLLCGTGDLLHVTSLEICVDTQENTLGNFGNSLPRLVQLRMNNSIIKSVRDLGTSLSHLQVLWMARCFLKDLDGISTFSSLKELYVAYNTVSDLSMVGMLENLQLLDLEGNDVDDLVQVQYLGLCDKLQRLTLEGNPVCVRQNPTMTQDMLRRGRTVISMLYICIFGAPDSTRGELETASYSYRAAVRELIPQLRYLDDISVEKDRHRCNSTTGEDLVILQNSIRDCDFSQAAAQDKETANGACLHSRSASARGLASSSSCVWSPSSVSSSRLYTGSRPVSATTLGVLSPPGYRPGSADSALATVETETSILTHGAGKILFCGNPVQAIRARREKLRTALTRSTFMPHEVPINIPEHAYNLEEPDGRQRTDAFAELRAWRKQHSSRLRAIETEMLPQILTIKHSDEEDEEAEDEEECFGYIGTESADEEHGEKQRVDFLDSCSPDSSFCSLSPDLHRSEALSPDVGRLSLSPDSMFSPSPPPSAPGATGNRKPQGIRARRLRICQTNAECLPYVNREPHSPCTSASAGHTKLTLHSVQQLTNPDAHCFPLRAHIPCPPPKNTQGKGLMDSFIKMDFMDSGLRLSRKKLQSPPMYKELHRPTIYHPHTASAALQKHHLPASQREHCTSLTAEYTDVWLPGQ